MELRKNDIQSSREEIRKKLKGHYGSVTEVAKRCDISTQWVRMILWGKVKMNLDVLETCWIIYRERENEKREKEERIIQLAKELNAAI